MGLMTGAEYIQSLRQMENRHIYYMGERVLDPLEHPVLRTSTRCLELTYDLARQPEYEDLMTASSHLLGGEKVNRFNHLLMSRDDLLKKVKMQRMLGRKTGCCFQRCAIMDAANAYYATTYEIDRKYGTEYHRRFVHWFKDVQHRDLFICPGITDPKGDRGKGPLEQADPDLYLRIVERRRDGVVINGAKMHLTASVSAHGIFIMPTRSLKRGEEDYCFAGYVPCDDPGVKIVVGRNASDLRKLYGTDLDVGNTLYSGQEAVFLFDHVFVPNEHIFMDGEVEFAGPMVDRFAAYHRNSYGGCKAGDADVLIGACALVAEYLGIEGASHVRDKLVEMTHLTNTLYSGGIASAAEGVQFDAGNWFVDLMLANSCKLNVTRFPFRMVEMAMDICGGLLSTAPSGADFQNPDTAPFLDRLLAGANGVCAQDKIRAIRLIENLTIGTGAVGFLVESMNGAGSPAAQKLQIDRNANFIDKKILAKHLAGIKE